MGIGTRKILKSEINNSTKSQTVIQQNIGIFGELESALNGFIDESALQGKGWESAKTLAGVYQTINQTFRMISEQISNANQKVVSSQNILLNDQIDEQALLVRIEQNKASMTQLSYANSIWNSVNPGQSNQNSYKNLQRSIGNENAELKKEIERLNEFDVATKSVYDEIEQTFSSLSQLLAQVSKVSNSYNSKTGTFPTSNIDMKIVNGLNKKYKQYTKGIQPEDIEVKWTAMNGAGEQYPLIYVNGKLDKEKTSDARWAMTKMGWANFKKLAPGVLAELLCINDFKTLLDPKSSFAENGMSLFSILLTFVPATKAVELAKAMKAAKMLEAGGETLVDLEKISKAAGLTESETKAFSKVISSENITKVKINSAEDILKNKELFKSPTNEANFWSGLGKNGDTKAADFTTKNGGTTLEQLLEKNNIEMPAYNPLDPNSIGAWEKASEIYAEQASGKVNAIIGENMRVDSIWKTYELPALKNNVKVTQITETNSVTGKVTILFER